MSKLNEEDLLPRLPIAPPKLGHRGRELDLTPSDPFESATAPVGEAAMVGSSKLPTGRVSRTARLAGLAGHTVATRAQTRLHGRTSATQPRPPSWPVKSGSPSATPRSSAT